MAFCTNCGSKIPIGSKFCGKCGTPVGGGDSVDSGARQQVYEGSVHKCPNCGETIEAFTTTCPSCGYAFRDVKASSSVSDFARQIKEIDGKGESKSPFDIFANALSGNSGDKATEKKIDLIRNYAVPNTKEDVLEFMILASSNVNADLYENNNMSSDKRVSDAWIAKMDQVYQKAKVTFGDDPEFSRIEQLHSGKHEEVKKSKSKQKYIFIGLIIFIVVDIGLLALMGSSQDRKEQKLEKELQTTVQEINEDISNGDYDDALIKANGLRFDKGLDEDKAEQWDEQREALIKLIEEKKAEEGK